MGSMSSYDAAPLPRLGEVFFDVRGDSRSMRVSWYGDTGVAVLSIWQAGRCTGTFRLPVDELDRMVATLRRGPDRGQSLPPDAYPPEAYPREGDYAREADVRDVTMRDNTVRDNTMRDNTPWNNSAWDSTARDGTGRDS